MCSCHVGVFAELHSRQRRRLSNLCLLFYRQYTSGLPPTGRSRLIQISGRIQNCPWHTWLYNNSGKSAKEVIAEYAAEQNCTEETAAEYLTIAKQNRSRVPFYATIHDEDSEETGEDVTRDDSLNYADILWNGIRADAVQAAFDKLSRKEKFFLEKRNAICMNCGRVMPWDERYSFEQLATAYEYSTTSGAERAYKKSPPLHTSTRQYIVMPTTTMNGEKSVLTFLPELRRS